MWLECLAAKYDLQEAILLVNQKIKVEIKKKLHDLQT